MSAGARPSGTRAGGRRSSTRSTSRCGTAPGSSTSPPSRSSTSPGRGRSTPARLDAPGGRPGRRSSTRPAHDGGGFKSDLTIMRLGDEEFRVVTGGGHGMADCKWLATTSRRTARAARRPARPGAPRASGAARPRHPRGVTATTSRTTASLRHLPDDRRRPAERPCRLAHLLRRRPRLGALRARRGARAYGTSCGRQAGARRGPSRDRRLRHDRPARRSATAPRHELESEYTVVEAGMGPRGQGRRTSSGRRPTSAAATRSRPSSARSPSTTTRPPRAWRATRSAVSRSSPATGIPSSDRRAAARTSRARAPALAREAPPHGVPAAGTRRRGTELAVEYFGERYPRSRSPSPARRPVFDPENAGSARERPRLREAGAGDRREDRAHRRRAGDRDAAPRLHDQPARGVRRRRGGAARRGSTEGRVRRPHARAARGRGAARDAMALGVDRAIHLVTDEQEWERRRPRRPSWTRSRRSARPASSSTWSSSATSRRTPGGYQVGIRVAHRFGCHVATGLKGVVVDGRRVRCEQEVPGGRDVFDLRCRCRDREGRSELPRYPSVPGRMRAQK